MRRSIAASEVGESGGRAGEIPRELELLVLEQYARAAAAWPGVAVGAPQFAAAIALRLDDNDPVGSLHAMHTYDLYLVCGCAAGDPAALEAFERHCGPAIARAIAASGASSEERADLAQVVRERLLVATVEGEAPRIATYAARGPLPSWVRVVAAREAARRLPRERRGAASQDDRLAGLIAPGDDPEIGYLKRLYRHEFKRAFHAAIGALDDRDRLVLQQYALDRLTIDQLAALHGVHRATAARWVRVAHDSVLASTERALIRDLRLTRGELASVIRLIQSQLEVSLERVLRV